MLYSIHPVWDNVYSFMTYFSKVIVYSTPLSLPPNFFRFSTQLFHGVEEKEIRYFRDIRRDEIILIRLLVSETNIACQKQSTNGETSSNTKRWERRRSSSWIASTFENKLMSTLMFRLNGFANTLNQNNIKLSFYFKGEAIWAAVVGSS